MPLSVFGGRCEAIDELIFLTEGRLTVAAATVVTQERDLCSASGVELSS